MKAEDLPLKRIGDLGQASTEQDGGNENGEADIDGQSLDRGPERLLKTLLNAIPLKIFWKDQDLRFCGCNDLFCHDAGLHSPNEIIGLTDFDLPWTKAEAEFFRSCDRQIIETDEPEIGIIETQTTAAGDLSWVETSKIPLHDSDGQVIGILGVYHDVTKLKESEHALQQSHDELEQSHDELELRVLQRTRELQYLAQHDGLTDLLNRDQFLENLEEELGKPESQFALLFVDLDRFKTINDSLGHGAGDQLLVQVSQILRDSVRPNDIVGRFGGDEFTLLLRDVRNLHEVIAVSDRIQSTLRQSILIDGCTLVVTASIGIVVDEASNYDSAGHVLRDADIAMYEAKGNGKARHSVFNDAMYQRAKARLSLENEMRAGLQNEEFFLQYQPVRDLRNDTLTGFEALVRWQHPTRGLVTPNEFIDIAEETGLIKELGESVLRIACRQLAKWREDMPQAAQDLAINVNLSAAQLDCTSFLMTLDDIVTEYGIQPRDIKIEITENLLLKDDDQLLALFQDLKDRGYRLLLDDFGTGFCSLSYLHRFPIDTLKIDRSFILSMEDDPQSKAIVKTILALARILDLMVVAEGVETQWQETTLRKMGCDLVQGFYYSQPMSPDDTARYILESADSDGIEWRNSEGKPVNVSRLGL